MMKVVTQKGTRSGRMERTISIRCSSLQEFSHSPAGDDRVRSEEEKGENVRLCVYPTWKRCVFWLGRGEPLVPVARVLLERVGYTHEACQSSQRTNTHKWSAIVD